MRFQKVFIALLSSLIFFYSNFASAGGLVIVDTCGSTCWSGLYIGAQGGYAWDHMSWTYQNSNYYNTFGPILLGNNFDFKSNTGIGGIDLGVNYQEWTWVFGLEGNVLYGNVTANRTSPFFLVDQYTSRVRWMALAKIRLGYAYDRFLFFITGGWAGGDLALKLQDTQFGVLSEGNEWSPGWTAGAGIDYMVVPHVSIGIAYDFFRVRLNNKTLRCPLCATGTGFGAPVLNGRSNTQTVMARLNYYFYQY